MEYGPMLLEKGGPPSLGIGVEITYYPDEEGALLHLLEFLESHLGLTEKDFGETINEDDDRFPCLWVDGVLIPFKTILKEKPNVREMNYEWITLGFHYEDQETFRAYKKVLDAETDQEFDDAKELFLDVEASYFGTKDKLN